MGSIDAVSEFKDYKDFAGLKQPTKITLTVMNQEQVMTLTSYEYGPMQRGLCAACRDRDPHHAEARQLAPFSPGALAPGDGGWVAATDAPRPRISFR